MSEQTTPLLTMNVEEEIRQLNSDYKIFTLDIENLEREMNFINNDNISILTTNLNKVKLTLEKLNTSILKLKNFISTCDIADPNNEILLNHITPVSICVSNKFEQVNKKFIISVNKAKKNIDNQISSYYNNKEEEEKLLKQNIERNLDGRTKIALDRLNERKQDLENISKITYQLLELSNNMKKEAEKQGDICLKIEKNIYNASENIENANRQLNIRAQTNSVSNRMYIWFTVFLIISLVAIVLYIYLKYFKNEINDNVSS